MFSKFKYHLNQIVYTIITILLLSSVLIATIAYIFNFEEDKALEQLHYDTLQIKNRINLQMFSDRENLITMASFASKLYSNNEGYDLLFNSFYEIGLIENIGILQPDNTFTTKKGVINVSDYVSFEDEVQKGSYTSGRVVDFTYPEREIVRTGVPIKVNDETVGILYGLTNLETLESRYSKDMEALGTKLYVIEGNNGNFIIDTKHQDLGNISMMTNLTYSKDYSYDKIFRDMTLGNSGYSAYLSQTSNENYLSHYSPLSVGDWRIMLAKPETVVFASATKIGNFLLLSFAVLVTIMTIYLLLTINNAKKKSEVSVIASNIRKHLLTLNNSDNSINHSLENVLAFAKARSAFFIDHCRKEHHAILPALEKHLLIGEDRDYFIRKIMGYISRQKETQGASVQQVNIFVNKNFKKINPELHKFLSSHGIHTLLFAGVTDDNHSTSIIGVINPKNPMSEVLIKDVAVCFAIAVYNKNHMVQTETMALTDSLTGLANRMAYKKDIKTLNRIENNNLACIYIDVNELHYYNNTHGHAAGDQMLSFIANELCSAFPDSRIYRMGGDEFLIFTEDLERSTIEKQLEKAKIEIEEMKYHISSGIYFKEPGMSMEELINMAEKEMYDDKALYYQMKDARLTLSEDDQKKYEQKIEAVSTGIRELDACLSVITDHYLGAYYVSLDTDHANVVFAPTPYFKLQDEQRNFSDIMKKYIHDSIKPEFQRMMLQFLDYDLIARQLREGNYPRITYTKSDGEKIIMSIHPASNSTESKNETVWIFEKEEEL